MTTTEDNEARRKELELKAISARARGDWEAERAALDGLILADRHEADDNEARYLGAVEAIAQEILGDHIECCFTTEHIYDQAEHIIESLAAEGYTVVKAEWEYGIDWPEGRVVTTEEIARAFERAPIVRRLVGPREPVPGGGAKERGRQTYLDTLRSMTNDPHILAAIESVERGDLNG